VKNRIKPTTDTVWTWVNKPKTLRPAADRAGRYSRPLSVRDTAIADAIGMEVRRLRTKVGMSTRELGVILGMSQPAVVKLELNRGSNIEVRLLWDLATAFDVAPRHFFDVCQVAVEAAREKHFAKPAVEAESAGACGGSPC